MAISAGNAISAADVLAALPTPSSVTTFSISSPTGSGWYRTAGAFVEVYGVTTGSASAGTSYTLTTLPAEIRPDYPVQMSCGGGVGSDREATGVINTDGTVVLRNNYSSAVTVQFHALYLLP